MEQLVKFLVAGVATKPDDVQVTVKESEEFVDVSVSAHPDDSGRVIGRGGKTINAIRTLAKVLAIKTHQKLSLTLTTLPPP